MSHTLLDYNSDDNLTYLFLSLVQCMFIEVIYGEYMCDEVAVIGELKNVLGPWKRE